MGGVMFLNPIWSLLLLAAPFVLYWFIIRPRLKARFTETYAYLDGFWERVWARTYAFRSFIVATLGAVATALPDLLVMVSGLDLSFLPQPWPMYTSIATSVALTMIRAFATTANERPPG